MIPMQRRLKIFFWRGLGVVNTALSTKKNALFPFFFFLVYYVFITFRVAWMPFFIQNIGGTVLDAVGWSLKLSTESCSVFFREKGKDAFLGILLSLIILWN